MLEVLLIIVSIALIIVCLLQTGKTDGIVNALTGQSSNLLHSLLSQFLLKWQDNNKGALMSASFLLLEVNI